jgi:hypothetical protein
MNQSYAVEIYFSLVRTSTVVFGSKCAVGKYTVDLVIIGAIIPADRPKV